MFKWMNPNCISVLILSTASRLCNSLRVLLNAYPRIHWIRQTCDSLVALQWIAEHRPDVVLLDAGMPKNEAWQVLNHIQSFYPHCRCIVLTHNFAQQERAERARAYAILEDDFSMERLFQALGGDCGGADTTSHLSNQGSQHA
jgi:DNA-binding NarL/FixJ family response regulator